MPKLTFTIGGEDHTVEVGDSCSIGRTPQNDIGLESEIGASRRHCQIMKLARSYELSDLGSTNGTRVNGKAVKRHRLEHGDRIQIGDTVLIWAERDDDDDVNLEEEISLDGDAAPAKRAAGGAASDTCYLVYAGGPNDGKRIALDKSRVTMGRKSSNTVVIESQAVSGYHCEVTRERGSYVLRDLGSTNGTMLDGDLITEVALEHGGRIRVGDQRLVFVDTSISDFEKAMANVDDLGSEWGMLRAEMDLSRVQKARRSQAVAVVAVFAVIGIAGYLLIMNPELLGEKAPTVAEIEGNKVTDFSFESLASGWEVAAGSPATGGFETGEGNEGKQGTSFYSVSRDGAGGRLAVVELSGEEFTVSPGRSYEFGASVKATGGGRPVVRVLWIGAGEGRVGSRVSSTGTLTATSWTNLGAVGSPPPNTTKARIQLANAGSGSAHFDDVYFKNATADAVGATAEDGGVTVSATKDGAVTISRGDTELLTDIRVTGGVFGDGAAATGAYPERAGLASVDVSKADAGVRLSGSVYDPFSDSAENFDVTLTPREGRYVGVTGNLPAGAALYGLVPESVMDKGVGVWTATGSFRETTSRYVTGAQRLSIGGLKRYEIKAADGTFPLGVVHDGGSHGIAVGAGEGGVVALNFDVDTKALEIGRDRIRSAAEDAAAQGRAGEAMRRYEDYASEFAEGDSRQDEALKRALALKTAGRDRLTRLRTLADGAVAYGEAAGLEAARVEAVALRDGFGMAEADQIRQKVEDALAAREKSVASVRARPVLARAQDYQANGMKRLARAAFEDVRSRFPGTEAAAAAETALRGMGN